MTTSRAMHHSPLLPSDLVSWETICVSEIQGFFHSHMKQLWLPILGGPNWHHNYYSGSVTCYHFKCLTLNIKSGEHAKVTVVPCHATREIKSVKFHRFFTIFLK